MSNNQLHPLLHGGVKVADLSVVSASNFLILTIEGDLYHFQNGSTFFVSPDTISASLTSTGSLYRVDRKYALWVFTAQSRQWRKIEEAGLVRSVTAAVDDTVWVLDEWNHLRFNINGEWKTHSGAMISYGVGIIQMTAAPDGTVLGTSYKSVLYKPKRDVFNENFAWDRFFDNMQFIHAASASHIIGVDGLGSIKTLSAGTFVPVPNDPKNAQKAYITTDGFIFVIDQQHHVYVLNQSLPFQTPITLPSPTQKSHIPLLLTPALNLQWYPFSTSQSFAHVSVASTTNIIAVTDSNKLVQFDSARDTWSLISADATYASVTTDGTIFKLDRSSKLHKFDGYAKTWEDQGKNFISITAKERTQAWALTNFGEMFALKNGDWKANEYVGKNWGRDIILASSGEDNTTVAITREGKLFYVENANVVHGWVDFVGLFPSPIPKMQYVDVGSNGAVVAVDCDGSVYRITHEGIQKLTSVGGLRFTKVSVGIDGLVVGLTLDGKLYSYGAPISNNPEQAIAEPQYAKPPVSMQSMMPADNPYAVPVPSSFTPQVSIPPAREPAFPSISPYGSMQSLQASGYPLLTSTDPISHISLTNSQNILVVTASGLLYQFVQSAWYLLSDDTLLAELAPENNGVIYRTDGCHNLFKYDPWQRQWMALGQKFRSFAIGPNNVIWGINDFEDVYVFENGNWKLQNDGATKKWGVGIMQISVGYDGTTLGVALKNKLCRHTGHGIRSWEGIGNAKAVAVGSSNQILTINGNDQLCKFGNTQSVPVPNLSIPVKSAKIGQDGTIVFVDVTGKAFSLDHPITSHDSQFLPEPRSVLKRDPLHPLAVVPPKDGHWIVTTPRAQFQHLSVANRTNVIAVTTMGHLYTLHNGRWTYLCDDTMFADIGVDGTMYRINGRSQVLRFDPGSRQWIDMNRPLTWVSVGKANHVWGNDSMGETWRIKNGVFENVDGCNQRWGLGITKTVVTENGSVVALNDKGHLFRQQYDTAAHRWEKLSDNPSLTLACSHPFVLLTIDQATRDIKGYNAFADFSTFSTMLAPAANTAQHGNKVMLKHISVGSDGTLCGIDQNGVLYSYIYPVTNDIDVPPKPQFQQPMPQPAMLPVQPMATITKPDDDDDCCCCCGWLGTNRG